MEQNKEAYKQGLNDLTKQAQELDMGYKEESSVLEGDYQFNSEGRKQFNNLSEAMNYLTAFGIKVFSIQAGYTQNGKYVVQASFQRQSEG